MLGILLCERSTFRILNPLSFEEVMTLHVFWDMCGVLWGLVTWHGGIRVWIGLDDVGDVILGDLGAPCEWPLGFPRIFFLLALGILPWAIYLCVCLSF